MSKVADSGLTAAWPAAFGAIVALALGGCRPSPPARALDPVLVDLSVYGVSPLVWIPGTNITVAGDAFVDDPWGESRLRLRGTTTHNGNVDVSVPLLFGDFEHLQGVVDARVVDALGGTLGRFDGDGVVEVISAVDGSTYTSTPLPLAIEVHDILTPTLRSIATDTLIFPNEAISLEAGDLLLAGEGTTVAVVEGCFQAEAAPTCVPITTVQVAVQVRPERDGGTFAFAPRIAGIEPGHFQGMVSLRNEHDSGNVTASGALPVAYDLTQPIVYGVSTNEATLGQYVDIAGAGFVGDGEGDTLLSFIGTFTAEATGERRDVDVVLLPDFVDGRHARYVISETDAIGQLLDVRTDAGTFQGQVTPSIAYGEQEVAGDPVAFGFSLRPVRQVVFVEFLPSYTESLRHFGLRAVDQMIRQRVFAVLARDYDTLNVEVRDAEPTDYALFARVEVGGPDPNGLGLLGYDNTPGKDTDNLRLYDRIGGVNAITQEDGYPGYGGIFIESLLGYSADPGGRADPIEPNADFDAVFDPFRAERGGTPVRGADLAQGVAALSDGDGCPAPGDRPQQLACAVWALGNMIGSTIAHEVGHSLGLADPYGPAFHNQGEATNRLMDADRPFEERAQLRGQGPSRFCAGEYEYLRVILPTPVASDPTPRPPCF